jgi:(R,R)-butanediol dehydrogenase/meso-butanediol dehydrogenase/diacetyl reductase
MLAARLYGNRDLRVEEVPDPPDPPAGHVVVRVCTAGVCGSDAHEYDSGPALSAIGARHPVSGHVGPLTIGHEFAGEVVACGRGVTKLAPGDLIACGAGVSCGECPACLRGDTNLCVRYATIGLHWDGGLAGYTTAPEEICLPVGHLGIGPDAAALIQPMSIAVHAARQARLQSDDTALIIGAGGIGAFLTWVVSSWGRAPIVTDIAPQRLELAAALGAGRTILAQPGSPLASPSEVPSVVFEVTGTDSGLEAAFAAAGQGTRIVVVGLQDPMSSVDLRRLTLSEQSLIGTAAHVCARDLPDAAALVAARSAGWADVAPEVVPLSLVVEEGLAPIAAGRARRIKTLVDPWINQPRPSQTVPRSRGDSTRVDPGSTPTSSGVQRGEEH